jgi:hypothetical protein
MDQLIMYELLLVLHINYYIMIFLNINLMELNNNDILKFVKYFIYFDFSLNLSHTFYNISNIV